MLCHTFSGSYRLHIEPLADQTNAINFEHQLGGAGMEGSRSGARLVAGTLLIRVRLAS